MLCQWYAYSYVCQTWIFFYKQISPYCSKLSKQSKCNATTDCRCICPMNCLSSLWILTGYMDKLLQKRIVIHNCFVVNADCAKEMLALKLITHLSHHSIILYEMTVTLGLIHISVTLTSNSPVNIAWTKCWESTLITYAHYLYAYVSFIKQM